MSFNSWKKIPRRNWLYGILLLFGLMNVSLDPSTVPSQLMARNDWRPEFFQTELASKEEGTQKASIGQRIGKAIDTLFDSEQPADPKKDPAKDDTKKLQEELKGFTLDLKEVNKDLGGVRVGKVVINGDETALRYRLEGNICSTCYGYIEMPIKKEDLKSIEYFKTQLAMHAAQAIQEKKDKEKREKAEEDKKLARADKDDETGCTRKIEDGAIECRKDKFEALLNKCDTMKKEKEQEKCERTAALYFRKNVLPMVAKGLTMDRDSVGYDAAVTARDSLLELSNAGLDNLVKEPLLRATTAASLRNAEVSYNNCLSQMNCAPGYAATVAKAAVQKDFQTDSQNIFTALSTGSSGVLGLSLYQTAYQNPLLRFMQSDTRNGIDFKQYAHIGAGLGSESTLVPGLRMPPKALDPEVVDLYRNPDLSYRGTRQVPEAFGKPRAQGAPGPGGFQYPQGQQGPYQQQPGYPQQQQGPYTQPQTQPGPGGYDNSGRVRGW